VVEGVSIDTRKDCMNKLFFALKGENGDGHQYLKEAINGGAGGLVVSSEMSYEAPGKIDSIPIFEVPDTLAGLQTLAKAYSRRVDPRIVAITGSTGKTSTKNMIATMVRSKYKSYSTPGNMNNHIGLPLTVLGMEGGEDLLVVEMGANHKGEIGRLCEICKPQIGVITNVGRSHLEYFGSLEGVAFAKAELMEALPEDGTAVLPADDQFFEFFKQRTEAEVVTFGYSEEADWNIENVTTFKDGGYTFNLRGNEMRISTAGKHQILNVAAAVATSASLKINMSEVVSAVSEYRLDECRGALFDIGGIIFMNDSYNSNPESLRAAVDGFMELPVEGKRWFVLGDMLELGQHSAELHREAGEYCGRVGVEGIVTLGEKTVELSRSAAVQRKAPPNISHFMDVEKLSLYLNSFLQPGDAVLVKGSRGIRMERVLEAIEKLREKEKKRID
jgi:UDP-N-acetylmuramoyl-tripeptide--D-alanyl-D-alanine ligase